MSPTSAPAPPPSATAPAGTEQLYERLCALTPAEFDELILHLGIPPSHLSCPPAPQSTRAIELIRYFSQPDRSLEPIKRWLDGRAIVASAVRPVIRRLGWLRALVVVVALLVAASLLSLVLLIRPTLDRVARQAKALANRERMVRVTVSGSCKTPPDSPSNSLPAGYAFWIDRREVSVREYRRFRELTSQWDGEDELPVVKVSFDDAAAYCASRGARLPMFAEWAHAAAGPGCARTYPWGSDLPSPKNSVLSWPGVSRPQATHHDDVGDVTPDGIRDLCGNVREWVDGRSKGTIHVARGGSFNTPTTDPKGLAQCDPSSVYSWAFFAPGEEVGFRCVAEITTDIP